MTTEKASLDAERSDTVLEKLKELREEFHPFDETGAFTMEFFSLLPRLIAALELVEAKARTTDSRTLAFMEGVSVTERMNVMPGHDAKRDFAREVLAVVNGGEK